jgi:ribosomal protein L12E/L44/L45/RPP1/RPP2
MNFKVKAYVDRFSEVRTKNIEDLAKSISKNCDDIKAGELIQSLEDLSADDKIAVLAKVIENLSK